MSYMQPYPFLFEPYLKEVLWGGERLCSLKGLSANNRPIGESWEICGLREHPSVVANGSLAGLNLRRLIDLFGVQLLGKHVFASYGAEFPLLIKYIDAAAPLSIQVHPNDQLAHKLHGEGVRGKTEMWYVMEATPEASLYSGFSRPTSAADYASRLSDGTVIDLFAQHAVQPGDVFFLPAGRVHAIGAGCLIAEIQQSSDITYRIYDYDRCDRDGRPRPLHASQALEAIDFTFDQGGYRTQYDTKSLGNRMLVDCPYFRTSLITSDSPLSFDLTQRDSFTVLQCVAGVVQILVDGKYSISLATSGTVLIPAISRDLAVFLDSSSRLVETYVPF